MPDTKKVLITALEVGQESLYRHYLEGAVEVRFAPSAQVLVASLRSWEPDAVLLDNDMPTVDALTITKAIRKAKGDAATEIYVVGEKLSAGEEQKLSVIASGARSLRDDLNEMGVSESFERPASCHSVCMQLLHALGLEERARQMVKILIAEDDERILALYDTFIDSDIFHKNIVLNGEQAIQTFAQWNPDMVLLDIDMPDVDGYQVLRAVRQVHGDRRTTFVMATSHREKQAVMDAAKFGIQGYLIKPFDLKKVNETLLGFREKHIVDMGRKGLL